MTPELLEEVAGVDALRRLSPPVHDTLQDRTGRFSAIDGVEQPSLFFIDRQKQVRIGVGPVDEHRHRTRRQPLLHTDRLRQPDRDIAQPPVVVETGRPAAIGAVVPVDDQAVAQHRPPEQLDRGILLPRRQRCKPGGMGCCGKAAAARQIGRLAHPAAELEPAALDQIKELRHAVSAILRVEQRVGQRVFMLKIGRFGQEAGQRVMRG